MAEPAASAPAADDDAALVATYRGAFAAASDPALQALTNLPDARLAARLAAIARFKRFTEVYCVEREFRDAFRRDPVASARRRGLHADAEDLEAFHEAQPPTGPARRELPLTGNVAAYLALVRACLDCTGRNALAASGPDARYNAWRARQRARHRLVLSPYADEMYRPVFAFELSRGCSVGCWFCGLSADRLREVWRHDGSSAATWRDTLRMARQRFGPAAGASICYWATDAFDNPDYERFVDDAWRIGGAHPPTLTALAWRDPERTRALLATSAARGCFANEFSILTPKILARLHASFTAADLLFAPLVPLSRDAHAFTAYPATEPVRKVNAGRARAQTGHRAAEVEADGGSIACVIGFLVNMAARRVELITPAPASDRWPLGYEILAAAGWRDAADLGDRIGAMIAAHMPLAPRPDEPVRFHPGLRFRPLVDGFEVAGRAGTATFRDALRLPGRPDMLGLGTIVNTGGETPGGIAARLATRGVDAAHTGLALDRLFAAGVLDEAAEGPRRG